MDRTEEVSGGLVIAGGNGAELLESGEEVLDKVARFVEFSIIVSGDLAISLGRDDGQLASGDQRGDDPLIGIERLIGDQRIGQHGREQVIGSDEIMGLSACQEEAHGVAQGIDQGMDLGAQPAARASDRLVFAGFFSAPALC